jgi:hypothetical protein
MRNVILVFAEKDDILHMWKYHFHELLNGTEQEQELTTMHDHNDTNEEESLPTTEEVETAVQKLKRHKVPGMDNIPAELFKYGGKEIIIHLHTIIKGINGKNANRLEFKYNLSHT